MALMRKEGKLIFFLLIENLLWAQGFTLLLALMMRTIAGYPAKSGKHEKV